MQVSKNVRALAVTAILGPMLASCGGSDDETVVSEPTTTVAAPGPDGAPDFTVVVTVSEAPLLLVDSNIPGAACGGDQGAGNIVESSRVELVREGEEAIEGLTGPGVLNEVVIGDDGNVASITCAFGAAIDVSAADDGTYDLIFTSGRTADPVTFELADVTTADLTGIITLPG